MSASGGAYVLCLPCRPDIPIPKRRKLYGIISLGGSACSYSIERETILHALYNLYTFARAIKRTPHQILRVTLFSDSLSVLEALRCNGPFRQRDLHNEWIWRILAALEAEGRSLVGFGILPSLLLLPMHRRFSPLSRPLVLTPRP